MDITYTDGSTRPSVIAIHEDLHNERSGYFRAYWSDKPDGTGNGCTVIGYCSPGGSHRTIKATIAEVKRLYPHEPVFRNGKRIAGWLLACVVAGFGLAGCHADCPPQATKAPADLVTVAQYQDGSFSVDVYGADGELETTIHLPADAKMSDMFPAKGE